MSAAEPLGRKEEEAGGGGEWFVDSAAEHGRGVAAAMAATVDRLAAEAALGRLIGDHPSMVELRRSLPAVARRQDSVLIRGEAGTGRSLCARILHMLGDEPDSPLVSVSCRALGVRAMQALESGGADEPPPRANRVRKALFEVAGGGTLVLEEVSALPLESQARLAALLQPGTGVAVCLPTGGRVRVIATTTVDLEDLVRRGAFCGELFDRLSASRLCLPPLRERGGDARLLVRHFARTLRCDWRHALWDISPAAVRMLAEQAWPGNVSGLRDAVKRALRRAGSGQILTDHVDLFSVVAAPSRHQAPAAAPVAPRRARVPRRGTTETRHLPAEHFGGVAHALAAGHGSGSGRA